MKKGIKVKCINDLIDLDKQEEVKKDFDNWIKRGVVYTVREVLHNDGIVTGILLEEVHNFPVYFKLLNRIQEPAFATWRFAIQKEQSNQIMEKECNLETIN